MPTAIKRLVDTDPVLCQQLRQRCYPINGCCAFDFAPPKDQCEHYYLAKDGTMYLF